MRRSRASVIGVAALLLSGRAAPAAAQSSPLLPATTFQAIRGEASGERPLVDFNAIVARFSGFTPSPGGDALAAYVAGRMREYGLDQVEVEGFPADGRSYVWAFLTEPSWEGETGTLTMVEPRQEMLADFTVHRVVLGRFSRSASLEADLVDAGSGTRDEDYAGKNVAGRIVLVSGAAGAAHARAVWGHKAAGIVWFREEEAGANPKFVSNPTIEPWNGPAGAAPGFAFGVSAETGMRLRRTLRGGDRVLLRAVVKAITGPGEYKQVTAAIPGTDPSLKEVWIKAHDNYRNTGGGNNLTGVGATIEMARVLRVLIGSGVLPRPRRTIRFQWSAEHYGAVYQFHKHPDRLARVLGLLNVDMTGFHQGKTGATMWVYRLPHSLPHYLSDVAEEILRAVGRANTIVLAERDEGSDGDRIYAPTGSREQMRYGVSDFWGPSDHEDVAEGSLRVPAVLYNDWPDPFIGTQEDDLDKVDPTQMRRAILAVAATAYFLAAADERGVTALVPVIVERAQARLAAEARRATVIVQHASAGDVFRVHREAANILAQSIRRETAILESVTELGASSEVDQGIVRGRAQLEALGSANTAALASVSRARAASMALPWRDAPRSTVEMRLQTLIPTRSMTVRGPVNIFRPEYGRTWLAEKVGGTGAIDALAVAKAGRYVWYELVNFVDGKRSLLDIRDAVSAEYGQIDAAAVEEYFRLLERAGVVSISVADPARPSRGPQRADFARWGGSSHREEKAPSAWTFSGPRGLRYHPHVARAGGRMHQPLRAHV